MTTMKMVVETARSTQSNLTNTHQQLSGLMQTMNNTVNGLPSSWEGNSATEFMSLYDQWKSKMNTTLEELNNMATSLQHEIDEWELMQSKLSS